MKFENLLESLRVDNSEIISFRYHKIVRTINQYYWRINSDSKNCRYVGSYGRGTAIKNLSDIDMLVILPKTLFTRFSDYKFNGQSSLLQNVKKALNLTYARTSTKADGQVVVVEFSDGTKFEVVPAFKEGELFFYPDSNQNGSWKKCNPIKEVEAINLINKFSDGRLKKITKLTRAWKKANDVDISGILIDCLAMEFILEKDGKYPTIEILFGEFLLYLAKQREKENWWILGSNDIINRNGMLFEEKALKGVDSLLSGVNLKLKGLTLSADEHWKNLFGKFVNGVM
ncbi:SMODS domain-containing nucleotidyltransferase [Bacillus sp. SG-1]|uniref:SMODS domain-containing nucleotidyltransferase n=1 Tax=Bacillus sp. SG-1 TaxID=161544 RepID=UPI00031150CF|nr:nucleotidyltransferase domain-containing protein [Bacillus sp. SG-1]